VTRWPIEKPTPALPELCNRLDNLPLALELAAARIPIFSPDQLLERLGKGVDLKGGRDADPRQQTLDATIRWSYDLLAPEERRLFARLREQALALAPARYPSLAEGILKPAQLERE